MMDAIGSVALSLAGAVVSLLALGFNIWLSLSNRRKESVRAHQAFRSSEFNSEVRTPFVSILNDIEGIVSDLRSVGNLRQVNTSKVESQIKEIHQEKINPLFDRLLSLAGRCEGYPHTPAYDWSRKLRCHQDKVLNGMNNTGRSDTVATKLETINAAISCLENMDKSMRAQLTQLNSQIHEIKN